VNQESGAGDVLSTMSIWCGCKRSAMVVTHLVDAMEGAGVPHEIVQRVVSSQG
jgi:hypothetical protein